jgi:hypothetical protein
MEDCRRREVIGLPLAYQEVPIEQDDDSLLTHYRKRQVDDGYLKCEDGRYFLTEKSKKLVQKEFKRYELRPGMIMLIEQHILEANDVAVY